MQHIEQAIEGVGGALLFSEAWNPESAPKAVVALVHGVTEHCGRYSNLVQPMVDAGIAVHGFDLRGHGRSQGTRGHVDSWRDYTRDLERVLASIRKIHVSVPVFLFGHSLGSLIALAFAMESPGIVQGVVVSGVAIDPVGVARPHLVAIARAFSWFWPTLAVPVKTGGRVALSRDQKVEARFQSDPLVLRRVTARFGTEALDMITWVKESAGMLRGPLLMIHGEADPLNTVEGARWFFERVTCPDKTLKVYPNNLHEPHNDLDHVHVMRDLREWIEHRI